MKFIVQTINSHIVHDFAFGLVNSMDILNLDEHLRGEKKSVVVRHEGCDFSGITDPNEFIPVGSVEFVSAFLKTFYPKAEGALKPLNVPEELFPFAGREIANVICREDFEPFWKYDKVYAKDIDTIKDQFNGLYTDIYDNYESKDFRHFQVSEVINIESEWRVFVFQNRFLDCRNYSGDCFKFPNPGRIMDMIKAYSPSAPAAYTLDIAVTENGETVVVECHRFFSCGLYGFWNSNLLPYMFSQTWFEMKNGLKTQY